MVHVQNATIAGGVAIGSVADLRLNIGGAMTVGFVAGMLSTFGFAVIQPWLDRRLGLKDTCGVHNLHGMPGVLGGISSIVATAVASRSLYGVEYDLMFPQGDTQAAYQLAGIGITLAIAIASGCLVGLLLRITRSFSIFGRTLNDEENFTDGPFWRLEDEEEEADHNEIEMEVQKQKMAKTESRATLVERKTASGDAEYTFQREDNPAESSV